MTSFERFDWLNADALAPPLVCSVQCCHGKSCYLETSTFLLQHFVFAVTAICSYAFTVQPNLACVCI